VTTIRTACARKQGTGVVLYWPAIMPGWNDQPGTMAHFLDIGQHTGCDRVYRLLPQVRERRLPRALPHGVQDYNRRKACSRISND